MNTEDTTKELISDPQQMTFLDFFSGIGGFHSGLEKAGMKCIGYCEFDKFAQESYKAIYDTEGLYFNNDIRNIKRKRLASCRLMGLWIPLPRHLNRRKSKRN